MDVIKLNLTEEEIKKVKKDFNNGQVYTDGCFCGHAISNFRDNLSLVIDFSCRKSMSCNNLYYQVTSVTIIEKALTYYSKEKVLLMINDICNDRFDLEDGKIDGREVYLNDDYYNGATVDDLYLVCDGLKFNEDSLRAIQKKLFKHYKKSYGEYSEAKFKDVGYFNY